MPTKFPISISTIYTQSLTGYERFPGRFSQRGGKIRAVTFLGHTVLCPMTIRKPTKVYYLVYHKLILGLPYFVKKILQRPDCQISPPLMLYKLINVGLRLAAYG